MASGFDGCGGCGDCESSPLTKLNALNGSSAAGAGARAGAEEGVFRCVNVCKISNNKQQTTNTP